ncbi:MAG: sensor histidine kinase [Desulfitobacterium sp.]
MVEKYFVWYLIYGFAMILMGIFAIRQKDAKVSNITFVKSLKYLGWFGITHGITEWITMILVVGQYPQLFEHLYNINQLLKSFSFILLIYFGLDLLLIKSKYRALIYCIPMLYFLSYMTVYIYLEISYGLDYHIIDDRYSTITMRYLMGLPAGILASIALLFNARTLEKTTRSGEIIGRYRSLGWILFIYALLEGLLVRKASYFPANLINRELFNDIFGFSILYLKAAVGIIVMYLLVKVIETFSWEQDEKLRKLEEHRIASEERRKLGLEIHDSIIQGLYASGLKVEYLILNKDENKTKSILEEVKRDLNHTIEKTREFITSSALDNVELEDLISSLSDLVDRFNKSQTIQIQLHSEISPTQGGYLSQEKSTQIYYIVQEAISNITKHSQAETASVLLKSDYDRLQVIIEDNGVGIVLKTIDVKKHFGISSMRERTQRIGGKFHIERIIKGTRIELEIPWEESN